MAQKVLPEQFENKDVEEEGKEEGRGRGRGGEAKEEEEGENVQRK